MRTATFGDMLMLLMLNDLNIVTVWLESVAPAASEVSVTVAVVSFARPVPAPGVPHVMLPVRNVEPDAPDPPLKSVAAIARNVGVAGEPVKGPAKNVAAVCVFNVNVRAGVDVAVATDVVNTGLRLPAENEDTRVTHATPVTVDDKTWPDVPTEAEPSASVPVIAALGIVNSDDPEFHVNPAAPPNEPALLY